MTRAIRFILGMPFVISGMVLLQLGALITGYEVRAATTAASIQGAKVLRAAGRRE